MLYFLSLRIASCQELTTTVSKIGWFCEQTDSLKVTKNAPKKVAACAIGVWARALFLIDTVTARAVIFCRSG